MARFEHIYGPVPSKRLGRSLGIDLVPFKTCTYDCIYCQLGRTTNKTIERKDYIPSGEILAELERRLADGVRPEYISLVGSGEPTLHVNIGEIADQIKGLTNIPLAVITNGSLLWNRDVQDSLMAADLVLPSLDAGDERLFQYINRPHPELAFEQMADGLAEFCHRFKGEVWLEVFLLGELTGVPSEAEKISENIKRIRPTRVQLNTVSRPPCEDFALAVTTRQISNLKRYFPGIVDIISDIVTMDSSDTPFFVPKEEEIIGLLERRPCQAEDVARGLGIHVTEAVKHLEILVQKGRVTVITSNGHGFFTVVE